MNYIIYMKKKIGLLNKYSCTPSTCLAMCVCESTTLRALSRTWDNQSWHGNLFTLFKQSYLKIVILIYKQFNWNYFQTFSFYFIFWEELRSEAQFVYIILCKVANDTLKIMTIIADKG